MLFVEFGKLEFLEGLEWDESDSGSCLTMLNGLYIPTERSVNPRWRQGAL